MNETQGFKVSGFKMDNNRKSSKDFYPIKIYSYWVEYRDNKIHFQTDHGYSLKYNNGIK